MAINLYDADGNAQSYTPTSITYELQDSGIAVCTLNTPGNLNALSNAQQWDMFAILDHATRDERVRCLVWTGAGRAFSSGAVLGPKNIKTTISSEQKKAMRSRGMGVDNTMVLRAMTLAFWDFPKPSIVAVNGLAVGGAANIALVNFHDLVYCSTEARFRYPFADLGFTPELGSSFMMPRLVGMVRAKELMFLGDWFDAQAAKDMGLVNPIFSPDDLLPEVMKVASRLCDKHPSSLTNSKRILNHEMRNKLAAALDAENVAIMKTIAETGGPGAIKKWKAEREKNKSKL